MGLVVLEGVLICLLVVTGLRQMIMHAIPLALKQAISVGIGLFIAFIGLVDSGFVTTPEGAATPVQLGSIGRLTGWPMVVFCFGLLLTIMLMARQVRGALLLSIVAATILAVIINAVATVKTWGLITPRCPGESSGRRISACWARSVSAAAWQKVGVLTVVIFIFTLVLSDFFDTMGTVIGVANEANLLDSDGRLDNIGRVLFIDGAAVAGGAASASSNTCFIESAAGVGEGARTGLANVVTGLLFAVALFLTPLTTVVPTQAAIRRWSPSVSC